MPRATPASKAKAAEKAATKLAVNSPVNQPGRELHTADMAVGQHDPIVLVDDQPIDREQIILPLEKQMAGKYLADLAFAEEPVTIRIERASEKFAPHSVDCWVNGVGAEVMIKGKWIQTGYLPIGHMVTTKRKYVEVLARSKTDSVRTEVQNEESEHPDNVIDRSTSMKTPFSVIRDDNPKGAEWLTRLLREL